MKPFKFLFFKRNSKISKSSKIYAFSRITNAVIGNYSYISYSCTINNCEIGNFCSIASGVKIGLGKHPVNFISTSPIFYSPKNPLMHVLTKISKFSENEKVVIGNDVWIGTNVTVLDGVKIGNGAIIGANSIVTKDVKPFTIVGGVPAKFIKTRFSENSIEIIEKSKWWNLPIEFFRISEVAELFSKELTSDSVEQLKMLMEEEKFENLS
ncbi:MAG: acetyltransferase-like isoleucine patch superfamily enzyme [Flavobacteriaceae bacterium]|jgi:acetyltransferase-like isoleucine patch superfamily enzyme